MKSLKRISVLFMVFVLLLSAIPSYAGSHWADEYVTYVIENGLWPEEEVLEPDKAISRELLASMAAKTIKMHKVTNTPDLFDDIDAGNRFYNEITALSLGGVMTGYERLFRPKDIVTREEMAVILDRLQNFTNPQPVQAEVKSKRFTDYEEISKWALNSIYNADKSHIMEGVTGKSFEPKRELTCGEAAKIICEFDRIYKRKQKNAETNFSVEDAEDISAKSRYGIYQKASVTNVIGISGFAVLAYYEKGPGEIYVSRETTANAKDVMPAGQSTFVQPTTVAAVYDPDGNTIALVDFSQMNAGKEAKIIKVDVKNPGIYTVRVMCGRTDDVFEIGMEKSEYWGVRGEKHLGSSETVPKPAYVYSHAKTDYINIGINSEDTVKLLDLEDNVIAQTQPIARTNPFITHEIRVDKENVKQNTVYKIEFPGEFKSGMYIDGIPGLMCPTVEAAEFLKGGWEEVDGTLYQGPLQRRAREEIVRLAKTKNLEVVINKPEELPEIQNPMAEAMLFGAYAPISGLGNVIKHQVTDPENPYCGRTLSADEYEKGAVAEEKDYQSCNFHRLGAHGVGGMAAAATAPLELNYAYLNDALIQRSAMAILYWFTTLSEDGYIRQGSLYTSYYPLVAGMFICHYAMEAFRSIEPYIDDETREVLESCFTLLIDKQGDYRGQGVTNQGMFFIADRLLWYQYTGIERHHETFKRGIRCFLLDNGSHNSSYHYVKGVGHFIESGLDTSYEYMNRQEFYIMYRHYRETPTADKELLKLMYECVDESLYFESFFTTPAPEYSHLYTARNPGPTSFASRTATVALGNGNNASYEQLYNEFPIAARRFMVPNAPANAGTYPFVINNNEWAMEFIKEHWDLYENYYNEEDPSRHGNNWIFQYLDAREADEYVEPCLLPCEEENGSMWERPGCIFFKHADMYFNLFYNCAGVPDFGAGTNAYSILGGGPVIIWNEKTGMSVCSQTHLNHIDTPKTVEDVVASIIYGADANGNLTYASGSETATLEWKEEGKEFVISGVMPNDGRTASWKYRLEEDGVLMTPSISSTVAGESNYVNLPLLANDSDNGAEFKLEENRLSFNFGGKTLAYTWEKGATAELTEEFSSVAYAKLRRLRIKMPSNKVDIKITCTD